MVIGIGMAIADPRVGKLGIGPRRPTEGAAAETEELRRRNRELERDVREGREREEEMRRELERTRSRLMAVEVAEERLCAQLGDLEAEAVVQAREYNRRIRTLSDRLAEAQRIIDAAGGRAGFSGGRKLVAVEGSR